MHTVVVIGRRGWQAQNDTRSSYSISVEPSHHVFELFDGSLRRSPGLPPGARLLAFASLPC